MKYYICLKIFFLSIFLVILSTLTASCQDISSSEKVTFIYIHGVYELNSTDFEKEIGGLHKYFANKKLGNYLISSEYKGVYWGQLSRANKSSALYEDGLMRINSSHNKSSLKKTSAINPFLLFNPFNDFSIFRDDGSSPEAVFFRNLLNNYMYDYNWVVSDNSHMNQILDLIQKKIDSTDGKYVLVCHSLGGAIAVNFIMNRILDPSNPNYKKSNYDNFAGLITSGDISNNLNSSVWAKQITPEDIASDKNNFIRYFVKNGKFWISYNHQNDVLATCLAKSITSYNDIGPGFIISKVNKTFFSYKILYFCKFWDNSDEQEHAHEWMFYRPKDFANKILKAYNKQLNKNMIKAENTSFF